MIRCSQVIVTLNPLLLFLFFSCDFSKIITVLFLSDVLKEYLVFSGHSNSVGNVWPCVKVLVPLVACEIIMVEGIQCLLLFVHWKKMGTYPLFGVIYVFLWLVLVIVGRQTIMIFTNLDMTSFYLSKSYVNGLWLLRRPFLYVFVNPIALATSDRVLKFSYHW